MTGSKKEIEEPVGLLSCILSSSVTKVCRVSCLQQDFNMTLVFLSLSAPAAVAKQCQASTFSSVLVITVAMPGWINVVLQSSDYYCFYYQSGESRCILKS